MPRTSSEYLEIVESRLQKICADYRAYIKAAITDAGGERTLSRLIGKSENYVRESLNGGISGLKSCAESIAKWDSEILCRIHEKRKNSKK